MSANIAIPYSTCIYTVFKHAIFSQGRYRPGQNNPYTAIQPITKTKKNYSLMCSSFYLSHSSHLFITIISFSFEFEKLLLCLVVYNFFSRSGLTIFYQTAKIILYTLFLAYFFKGFILNHNKNSVLSLNEKKVSGSLV